MVRIFGTLDNNLIIILLTEHLLSARCLLNIISYANMRSTSLMDKKWSSEIRLLILSHPVGEQGFKIKIVRFSESSLTLEGAVVKVNRNKSSLDTLLAFVNACGLFVMGSQPTQPCFPHYTGWEGSGLTWKVLKDWPLRAAHPRGQGSQLPWPGKVLWSSWTPLQPLRGGSGCCPECTKP